MLADAARQKPDDAVVLQKLAWAAYAVGKVQEANVTMQKAAAASPDAAVANDAKRFLAMLELSKGENDPTSAAAQLQEVLATTPDYAPALVARAAIESR